MADVSLSQALSAYTRSNKMGSASGSKETTGMATPHLPNEGPNTLKPQFTELVGESLKTSAAGGYESEAVSAKSLANEAEFHELVTTVSNAELTLNTVVAVRDRVITAYQDIIKMPI
tara:strand:- start:313 stop:663 length:351 start_codon:yes stop_codon:yes gene_type:complete